MLITELKTYKMSQNWEIEEKEMSNRIVMIKIKEHKKSS